MLDIRARICRELIVDIKILGLCLVCACMCQGHADDGTVSGPSDPRGIRLIIRLLQTSAEDPDVTSTAQGAARYLRTLDQRGLVPLLTGMKSQPLPVVNWLRSIFDDLVVNLLATSRTKFPQQELRVIAESAEESPYARRLAIELLEVLEPGTLHSFLESKLDDAVFVADAVDQVLRDCKSNRKQRSEGELVCLLKSAFMSAADTIQIRALGEQLIAHHQSVDIKRRLGVIENWHLLGPTSNENEELVTSKIWMDAEFHQKTILLPDQRQISWSSIGQTNSEFAIECGRHSPSTPDPTFYATSTFHADRDRTVDIHVKCGGQLQLWLNGESLLHVTQAESRAMGEEYKIQSKIRHGVNRVLIKVRDVFLPGVSCDASSNCFFSLRMTGSQGHGLTFDQTL